MAVGDTIRAYRATGRADALQYDKQLSFWKDSAGNWFIHFPNAGVFQLTPTVAVTEHGDGTITTTTKQVVNQRVTSNGTTVARAGTFTKGCWTE